MSAAINKSKKKEKVNNLLLLIPYLKPYHRELFYIFVTLIFTSAIILFIGKIVKYLIDQGFESRIYLNYTLLALVITIFTLAIAGYFRSFLVNSVSHKVIADLKKEIYAHVIRVSSEFFEVSRTGDVISRLTVDTSLLHNTISSSIAFFVRNFLLFCGGLALLFSTSPTLTLVSLALIPLSIAPIFIMGKKVKQASKSSQEALSEVGSHIGETVSGIKTIQSYLCEEKEVMKFNKYLENSLSFLIKKVHFRALIISLVIAASFGTIAIVLWFGGNMVLDKRMSSGDLSSFIFYSVICATSLVAISQIMGQLQIASGAVKRLFELLDIQSPVLENSSPEKLIDKKGHEIIFQDVSFAYPSSKENLILKNLNLDILPYEKIAIVGKSGGGKSTILQLLMRFYDVNSGEIIINGQNIKNLSLEDLRGLFSYISQDCFIFSGTIFENIAYGDSELTGADVEKIVEDNQSLHFIKYMPDGLQTSVGEKGIKLSGGEKQRISIARAIVKNSPILLLDEATSALDNENESLVTEALKKLTKNRTVITVAHSLSSIINCDRIIFITNGKIMEVGSHQELIKKDGLYKKMYDHDL